MTKSANIESIEKATGKSWEDWLKFLDKAGAKAMAHPDIVHVVYEHLVKSGVFDDSSANQMGRQNSSGWWSQGVTVAYEQHIGRRQPGQRADGSFEISVTKVLGDSMADTMKWWTDKVKGRHEFNGVKTDGEPRLSSTPRAHSWRADLTDGSKLLVTASERSSGKAMIAITIQKLTSTKAAESWRTYCKQLLRN